MILKENCMRIILQKVPEFISDWKEHLMFWNGDEPGLCNDLSAFSTFVIENLAKMDEERKAEVFNVIEYLLLEGEQCVQEAVATCFLENLQNSAEPNKFPTLSFVSYLGQKSREYCLAWDEFTGAKTDGL